ncbi:putative lipoprotein [Rhodobacterales bacterium HTCC2150]|nr:putative lipoprotein [Rhodobacterales bacterium HTCC2150] [Rhodobacteraceae bacterium HTCC2150]
MSIRSKFIAALKISLGFALCAILAGCGSSPTSRGEINDPYEVQNRRVHQFNLKLDKTLVKPASNGYGKVIPEPVRMGVDNFADNAELPGMVLNNLLQLRLGKAIENSVRFTINTTIGVLGLFDVATKMQVYGADTDFGETLSVWGVPEGNYVELPALGPSTERAAVGTVVDYVMNPLKLVVHAPHSRYLTGAKVLNLAGSRYRYSDVVDQVLYESADSYAQARLFYLQSRRFELDGIQEEEYVDPYAN